MLTLDFQTNAFFILESTKTKIILLKFLISLIFNMKKANDDVSQIIPSHFINIICQMLTLFLTKFVREIIHLKTVIKVQ